jgi:hypothetical protein
MLYDGISFIMFQYQIKKGLHLDTYNIVIGVGNNNFSSVQSVCTISQHDNRIGSPMITQEQAMQVAITSMSLNIEPLKLGY